MATCGLFVISQLYKHSTPNDASNAEAFIQKSENSVSRPVVLPLTPFEQFHYVEPSNSFFKQKHNVLRTKVDWHNYTHIEYEKNRRGPGEQGKTFELTNANDIKRNTELLRVNGYWAVASDLISPNRSVADIRHPL